MRYLSWISATLILTACGIGGQWMNGNPSAGKNIKPYLHYWVKEGVTAEQRREDSWGCGAGKTQYGADHVAFSREQANIERKPKEIDDIAARERLESRWIICMKSCGYSWEP